jgi:hypothetical protein
MKRRRDLQSGVAVPSGLKIANFAERRGDSEQFRGDCVDVERGIRVQAQN